MSLCFCQYVRARYYTNCNKDRNYQEVRFGSKDESPCLSQRILAAMSLPLFLVDHPVTKRLVEWQDRKPKRIDMNHSNKKSPNSTKSGVLYSFGAEKSLASRIPRSH